MTNMVKIRSQISDKMMEISRLTVEVEGIVGDFKYKRTLQIRESIEKRTEIINEYDSVYKIEDVLDTIKIIWGASTWKSITIRKKYVDRELIMNDIDTQFYLCSAITLTCCKSATLTHRPEASISTIWAEETFYMIGLLSEIVNRKFCNNSREIIISSFKH